MGIHIVTGYAGKEHVTSADAGSMNAGIVKGQRYASAEQFRCGNRVKQSD